MPKSVFIAHDVLKLMHCFSWWLWETRSARCLFGISTWEIQEREGCFVLFVFVINLLKYYHICPSVDVLQTHCLVASQVCGSREANRHKQQWWDPDCCLWWCHHLEMGQKLTFVLATRHHHHHHHHRQIVVIVVCKYRKVCRIRIARYWSRFNLTESV